MKDDPFKRYREDPEMQRKRRELFEGLAKLGCLNCGEKGPHYIPPCCGDPGFYMCEKKQEPAK